MFIDPLLGHCLLDEWSMEERKKRNEGKSREREGERDREEKEGDTF